MSIYVYIYIHIFIIYIYLYIYIYIYYLRVFHIDGSPIIATSFPCYFLQCNVSLQNLHKALYVTASTYVSPIIKYLDIW